MIGSEKMNLTDEQKIVQSTVSTIAQQELAPKAAEVDEKQLFPRAGIQKLAEKGFLGMAVPKPMGGYGSDTLSFVLATEAIAKCCASTGLVFLTHSVVARAIALAGSDNQKSQLLPALINGEKLGAFAANEPGSGSNTLALSTKATTEGDNFIINGTKSFITNAEEADVYMVLLRTDQAKIPPDLSAVIFEKGMSGFSFGNKEDTMGLRGTSDGELIFDDCRVPKANLLGAENKYLEIMPRFLGLGLVGCAAVSLGIAQAAVDATIEHAKTRVVAGQPLGQYQGIQFSIAEMSTELAAARALTHSAAQQMDTPPPPAPSPLPIYMSKLYATEMAINVTNKALQAHGGHGYNRELPVERLYRDARGLTLHFSPSEMIKGMVGKMFMGMPPM
jgi:butyryl-CoA dehydrogenase